MGLTRHEAYFLVGPTAVGKTAVAHLLARERALPILSVDSMLVYRGMDIGTAKPSPAERTAFHYAGVDLTDPAADFSAAAYLGSIRAPLATATFSRGGIAVGGTGLYVRCLIEGLSGPAGGDPEVRARAESLLATGGVAALQAELRRVAPERLAALSDPKNPRRLVRALEMAELPISRDWKSHTAGGPVITGLWMERAALERRIRTRVEAMYADGLLEEAAHLRRRYPRLSATALQAIGYAEAFAVLDGQLPRAAAMERTAIRTRQLAKKQMTWFRRQHVVEWIEVNENGSVEEAAAQVLASWRKNGPIGIHD